MAPKALPPPQAQAAEPLPQAQAAEPLLQAQAAAPPPQAQAAEPLPHAQAATKSTQADPPAIGGRISTDSILTADVISGFKVQGTIVALTHDEHYLTVLLADPCGMVVLRMVSCGTSLCTGDRISLQFNDDCTVIPSAIPIVACQSHSQVKSLAVAQKSDDDLQSCKTLRCKVADIAARTANKENNRVGLLLGCSTAKRVLADESGALVVAHLPNPSVDVQTRTVIVNVRINASAQQEQVHFYASLDDKSYVFYDCHRDLPFGTPNFTRRDANFATPAPFKLASTQIGRVVSIEETCTLFAVPTLMTVGKETKYDVQKLSFKILGCAQVQELCVWNSKLFVPASLPAGTNFLLRDVKVTQFNGRSSFSSTALTSIELACQTSSLTESPPRARSVSLPLEPEIDVDARSAQPMVGSKRARDA